MCDHRLQWFDGLAAFTGSDVAQNTCGNGNYNLMSSRALPTDVFGHTYVRARWLTLTSHVYREEFLPSTRLLSSWARVVEIEVKDYPGRHPGQVRRGSRRSSELGKTEPTFCMNEKYVESPNEHALLGGSIAICICGEPGPGQRMSSELGLR